MNRPTPGGAPFRDVAPTAKPGTDDPIRVLLVDGDAERARRVRRVLGTGREERFKLERASRLNEALQRLRGELFDAILLSLDGPRSFGVEAAAKLQAWAPGAPVIVLSERPEALPPGVWEAGVEEALGWRELESHVLARSIVQAVARKRAETALRSSQEQLRVILEQNPDGILVVSADGNVEYANRAAVTLLGRSRDELMDKPFEFPIREVDETEIMRPDGEVRLAGVRVARAEGPGPAVRIISLHDHTERRDIEHQIRMSRARLRNLAARLHFVREEERTAVAREIHDQLGQSLTALKMDLGWLMQNLSADGPVGERVRSMNTLVDSTLDTVRRLSSQLRPAMLDDLGLEAAIEWQTREFARRTGCAYALQLDAAELKPERQRDIVVFRILQEALTNVARHAEASKVEVALRASEDQLILVVRDDGKGITEDQVNDTRSLGVIGMRERAGSLGGRVYVSKREHGGTSVQLQVPLQPESDGTDYRGRRRA